MSVFSVGQRTVNGGLEAYKGQVKKHLHQTARPSRLAVTSLAASLMLAFGSGAYALPSGGAVSAGSATIAPGTGTLTINQSSQNVAINWQSFSIGQSEAVRFVQPNSSSVALNRVLGSDPSSILGSLSANGKVFLVNPNGILFGQGAQVNVGALVASTRGISDVDFMAGNYKFAGNGAGAVVNQGTINANGGFVALLGANVSNEGVISARLGTVALAAGNAMTLDVAGDGLLNVVVNEGAVNALAHNGGMIRADGGQVLLSAQSAGTLLQSAVNNAGVIQAQTVENHNGTIRLLGDMQSGTVSVGGTLDVSGTGAGQTGGTITATGHHVGLFDGHLNARGDAGGGTVLIGGGFQGGNPAVQNASATYMSAGSTINADALTNGSGGTVVLWANESTRAKGSISARGGVQGGDGGLVETSAHWLDVTGITVNASAAKGKRGLWLLDPADVTIGAGTTNATLIAGVFTPDSGVGAATVDAGALRTALEAGGGTDITITTTNAGASGTGMGDITIAAALTFTPVVDATLTLNAARDVNIDAAVSITRGNLVVCCGRDINVRAAITIDTATGAGGSVLLNAGRDVRIERSIANPGTAITVTDGNIEICAGRDVILSNTLNPGLAPLMTLTNGSTTGGLDLANLGVPLGLTLRSGGTATGPGPVGGTVNFVNGGLAGTFITTTTGGPGTPISIFYNPVNYTTPTAYSLNFTGTGGPVTSFMLVYPDVLPKIADGTTTATLAGFKTTALSGPVPGTVTLLPGGTAAANFDTAAPGTGKTVSFSDFSLVQGAIVPGDAGINFALPSGCCGLRVGNTTGTITASASSSGLTAPPVLAAFPLAAAPLFFSDMGGITMPPIVVAEAPPVEFVPPPVVVEAPAKPVARRYVAPAYAPKKPRH
jgi:filamentous hemagglutinin family protein